MTMIDSPILGWITEVDTWLKESKLTDATPEELIEIAWNIHVDITADLSIDLTSDNLASESGLQLLRATIVRFYYEAQRRFQPKTDNMMFFYFKERSLYFFDRLCKAQAELDKWQWPLPGVNKVMPPEDGTFGAIRKHDIHTGIDLHCEEGQAVLAVEKGIVTVIIPFTGPQAESPWWHPTQAVMVEGKSGVVCYGEISPSVTVGQVISPGDLIGNVCRVLKNDKGRPTSMLHLELYVPGTKEAVWWKLNKSRPKSLKDPTQLLFTKEINDEA